MTKQEREDMIDDCGMRADYNRPCCNCAYTEFCEAYKQTGMFTKPGTLFRAEVEKSIAYTNALIEAEKKAEAEKEAAKERKKAEREQRKAERQAQKKAEREKAKAERKAKKARDKEIISGLRLEIAG